MAAEIVFNDDGSVTVPLTRGFCTTLDQRDFAHLFRVDANGVPSVRWCAVTFRGGHTYACRGANLPGRRTTSVYLHREILRATRGVDVDHIDRDPLNNRRSNLRLATRSQNNANRPGSIGGASPFKGVSWCKQTQKWRAKISVNNRTVCLGRFANERDAACAYDQAAISQWGDFALTNFGR